MGPGRHRPGDRPRRRAALQGVLVSTTLRSLAGLVAGSALLVSGLSGCGVAGTDFHPGVAARVGDATVSVDEVDSLTDSYCSAIEDQLTKAKNVVPLGYLRSGV